ncbi:MAG: DNA topoisomerase IV subunit A, partial [Aquincola sp.]|nr:DNA topoisomerase IV subunit A [Aquincola sp.]
ANTGGYGLLAKLGDLLSRQRGGKSFLTLEGDAKVLPPVPVQPAHTQVATLAMDGRLLVFALDELKLQPGGGKGLTLMDVDAASPLVSVATLATSCTVHGSGRGGKAKEEVLRNASLAEHVGKRARKGRKVDGLLKVLRVVG